jgi:hypothetical protein
MAGNEMRAIRLCQIAPRLRRRRMTAKSLAESSGRPISPQRRRAVRAQLQRADFSWSRAPSSRGSEATKRSRRSFESSVWIASSLRSLAMTVKQFQHKAMRSGGRTWRRRRGQASPNCIKVREACTLTPQRTKGHAAETPSSGCAASPLRFDPFGMTASRRRGKVASKSFWCAMRPIGRDRSPKRHGKSAAIAARSGQGRRSRPRSGLP